MKIDGKLIEAQIVSNGRFEISIKTDYDKMHSGSDTNRQLQNMVGKTVTITIEE
jgi:hypothetical protein